MDEVDITTDRMINDLNYQTAQIHYELHKPLSLTDSTRNCCIDCGKPIGKERLLAVPNTIRCLQCQDRFDNLSRNNNHY